MGIKALQVPVVTCFLHQMPSQYQDLQDPPDHLDLLVRLAARVSEAGLDPKEVGVSVACLVNKDKTAPLGHRGHQETQGSRERKG